MKHLTTCLAIALTFSLIQLWKIDACCAQQEESNNQQIEKRDGTTGLNDPDQADAATRLRKIIKQHEDNHVTDPVDRQKLLDDFRKLAEKLRARRNRSQSSDKPHDARTVIEETANKSGSTTTQGKPDKNGDSTGTMINMSASEGAHRSRPISATDNDSTTVDESSPGDSPAKVRTGDTGSLEDRSVNDQTKTAQPNTTQRTLQQRVAVLERELRVVNEKLNWLYKQFTHETGK